MGNRAVITTEEKKIGVYLHWNGGRDSVEPLLKYCELQGYRAPETDCYGWARLAQVAGNFFGGALCVGIDVYEHLGNPGDNGVYIIKDWKIVGREYPYEGEKFHEQNEHDFFVMLREIDKCMPEKEQLGEFLNAVEVPVSEVVIDDEVWIHDYNGTKLYKVIGFGDMYVNGTDCTGLPYIALYGRDGHYQENINNYIRGNTCYIKPHKY